jgi:DNA-binding MarR family transcriptional regulator
VVSETPESGSNPQRHFDQTEAAAWVGFLDTHAKVVRRLDALLAGSHGMTLNEFEVLLKLALAGGSLRMSDLADAALISRSGLTRIIDELEAQGLVIRRPDEEDGRVLMATLTRRGRSRFTAARRAHAANVRALFLRPLGPAKVRALGSAWAAVDAALPDGADEREPARARRGRRSARVRT